MSHTRHTAPPPHDHQDHAYSHNCDAPPAQPRVGVGVLIVRQGMILMGLRKGAHGAGTWAPPGGHLEFGETIEHCAQRETQEETGLVIHDIRLGPYTNDIMQDAARHYVTCFVLADAPAGEARVLEPEKCEQWQWHDWNNLPENLFLPLRNLRASGFRLPVTASSR